MSADLLRAPGVGRFLRWRHSRTVLQAGLLGLAALVVLDGFLGPRLAPRNLAGTLPWVHWRGAVVLALLVAGNLFCMACPFMLVRRLSKRLFPADRPWPARLRPKWAAAGLLVVFLWAYEAFDLWATPWWTAWVVIAYFAAAFVVDGFFRGAAFCKHLCPIGQFNFYGSWLSPLEVRVRDPAVCAACRTKDCIRGRYADPGPLGGGGGPAPDRAAFDGPDLVALAGSGGRGPLLQRGCELWLFQERKVGNTDCTFCMECIQACPWDNVGILTRTPAAELAVDPWRSGVGRLSRRPDLAALCTVLTFGAFLNAFGMVATGRAASAALERGAGGVPGWAAVGVVLLLGVVAAPAVLVGGAAWASRALSGARATVGDVATRYAYGLAPLGFAMWTAHHLYHFLLGAWTVVPVALDRMRRAGLPAGETPAWATGTLLPESWLRPLELLVLEAGLLATLWVTWRIARREHGAGRRARWAAAPWAVLAVGLALGGMWLLTRPMEMRGMLAG